MSDNHNGGNIIPEITREEHDGTNNAKRVNVVAGGVGLATVTPLQAWPDPKGYIGLVTITGNLSASLGGNVTLNPSENWIGLATVNISNPTLYAVVNTSAPGVQNSMVTLNAGPNYIGLATVDIGTTKAWPDPKTYIGLVTVANTVPVTFSGNVTLDAGSKTQIVGNITLADPKGFIGLVTVGNTVNTSFSGNITLDAGSKTQISGNLTLSDPKGYIGLVTVGNRVDLNSNVTLNASPNYIGLVTVANTVPVTFSGNVTLDVGSKTQIIGNVTLSDPKTYIGLTTSTIGNNPVLGTGLNWVGFMTITSTNPTSSSGNVTLDAGSKTGIVGNLTLSDSKGFIGLVSVSGFANPLPVTFSGNVTLDVGSKTQIVGNLTLSDPKGYIGLVTVGNRIDLNSNVTLNASPNYIGLVTVANTVPVTFSGNVTLDDGSLVGLNAGANYIGLVTVANTIPVTFSGNVTLDVGSLVGVRGNITLSPSVNWIGFVTVANALAWPDPKTFIGLVTVAPHALAGNVTLDVGSLVGIRGNLTLSDPKSFIGLVTIGGISQITLSDPKGYIGLTTASLGAGTQFIGLVTAWSRNAGTTKTLIHKNIELSTSSIATIAVASGGNAIFNITQLLLSSDATVRMSVKSGVTYLTGNASIGISLNPGGGWVESGSPDSPCYIGLSSGSAIVLEKFDMTATSAKVGGKVMFFQE